VFPEQLDRASAIGHPGRSASRVGRRATNSAASTLTPRALAELLFVCDFAGAVAVLFLATWLRNNTTFATNGRGESPLEPGFAVLVLVVWTVAFWLAGVYPIHHWRGVFGEWQAIGPAFGLAALVSAGLLYLSFRDTPRPLFLYFLSLDLPYLLITRALVELAYRLDWLRFPVIRVAIVGTGPEAIDAAAMVVQRQRRGIELVGFIGDGTPNVAPLIGPIEDLVELIRRERVTHVIVSSRSALESRDVLPHLVRTPVTIMLKPDSIDLGFARSGFEEFSGMPLLNVRPSGLQTWQRTLKRFLDLALVVPALLVVAPFMGLIALTIRADSSGAVLFRQKRVGEGGEPFTMLKFRTMRSDTPRPNSLRAVEGGSGEQPWRKSKDDPRVTRVGRFLRIWSLDELPQLWNIVKGDMSTVGPRPELPEIVESQYADWQYQRFSTPPGLTGWWQVNGRSDRPMHEHVEDDIYYIQHYSPWLDLVILAKTIPAVLSRKGAY
jgi:exopolysaccharide biosynthesis polyprenyl glycosylphosphotransferase